MRPPSLPELQHTFARGVFGDDPTVLALIASPAERLTVYRNSVLANLRATLREIYPVVLRLTGERFFEQAAANFARSHVSESGDLHRYGKQFAEFLASYQPAKALAYLPDVARLEWLWHEVFHAPDAQAMELSALATIVPDDYRRLRFQLQPGCRLLVSAFPIHRIWEANQPGYAGEENIDLDQGAVSLVIYRFGYEVRIAPVSRAEQTVIESLAAGEMFERTAARAAGIDPEVNLGTVLSRLVSEQIIAGFELATAN